MRPALSSLREFAFGGDPPVRPRTRLGRALPYIGVVVAIFVSLASFEFLDGEVNAPFATLFGAAVAVCVPIALVANRPLLAWRIHVIVCVLTAAFVPVDIAGSPWPWQPTQMLLAPVLLAVVSIRHNRGVLVWVSVSAVLLVGAFADRSNAAALLLAVAAIVVTGDQIRRRREVQHALQEEEERTELAQARRAIAEERNRIAREMHDIVAHHMSLIAVRAETAVYRIEGIPPAAAEELAAIAGTSREALTEMRRLLGVLRDSDTPLTEPQPTLDDVSRLVQDARDAGVEVTFEPLPGETVPAAVGLAVFRIVQEALSNARRHAAGAPVRIGLTRSSSTLELYVHSGRSSEAPAPSEPGGERHGLLGMRERAAAVGGTLRAGPFDDGYTVHATLPLS